MQLAVRAHFLLSISTLTLVRVHWYIYLLLGRLTHTAQSPAASSQSRSSNQSPTPIDDKSHSPCPRKNLYRQAMMIPKITMECKSCDLDFQGYSETKSCSNRLLAPEQNHHGSWIQWSSCHYPAQAQARLHRFYCIREVSRHRWNLEPQPVPWSCL